MSKYVKGLLWVYLKMNQSKFVVQDHSKPHS